jgi:hypothetical protein
VLGTTQGASRITKKQSGKRNILFGYAAGAPGNARYNLSFNDFNDLCIQYVFASIYQCTYIATKSTHIISGLATGGNRDRMEVPLKMTIE